MNYKIKKLYRNAENKEGKPYMSQGKYYKRVSVYLEGIDGSYSLNDFDGITVNWKEGDTKDLILSEENGFKNFTFAGQATQKKKLANSSDGKQLDRIEAKLDEVYEILIAPKSFEPRENSPF